MFNLASEETFTNGQIIFKEDSSGDWVYVILSGSVEISKSVEGKNIIIAILKQGEIFGELSFLGDIKRTATARAVGETTLGVLDRAFLDAEFNKLSSDFRSILGTSIKRFVKMLDRASDFSTRTDTRVQKTLSVTYKDGQSLLKAYTGNISGGGLFLRADKPLNQGEGFLLKLKLPGLSVPMNIKCEVAWARKKGEDTDAKPAGMGTKFIQMSKKDNQTLKQYLKGLMKD